MSGSSPAGSFGGRDGRTNQEDDDEIKAFEKLLSNKSESSAALTSHTTTTTTANDRMMLSASGSSNRSGSGYGSNGMAMSGNTQQHTFQSPSASGEPTPRFTRMASEVVYGLVDSFSPTRPTPTSFARHIRQRDISPSPGSNQYNDSMSDTTHGSAGMHVEQMKRRVIELTNEIKAKDIRHKIVHERAALLESSLNSALDSLKHHKNAKLAMEKKVEELVREHLTKDERIKALKKQIEALENDGGGRVAELHQHLEDRKHELAAMEQTVQELRLENTELIAELDISNQTLSQLRNTASEGMSDKVRELMAMKSRSEGAVEAMKDEIAALRVKADDYVRMQTDLERERAEVARLRGFGGNSSSHHSGVSSSFSSYPQDNKHQDDVMDRLSHIEQLLQQQQQQSGSTNASSTNAAPHHYDAEKVADDVASQLQSHLSSTVDDLRVDIQASLSTIPEYVTACLEKLEVHRNEQQATHDEEHDRELKEALHDLMDKLNVVNFGVQETQQLVAMGVINVNVTEHTEESKVQQTTPRSAAIARRHHQRGGSRDHFPSSSSPSSSFAAPGVSSEVVHSLQSVMASMTNALRESLQEVDRRQGQKLTELQTFLASEFTNLRGERGMDTGDIATLTAQLQHLPRQVELHLEKSTSTLMNAMDRLPLEIAQDWSGAMMKINEQLEVLRTVRSPRGFATAHSDSQGGGSVSSSSQSFATVSDKLSSLLRNLNRKVMSINIGRDDRNALLSEISIVLDEAYRRQSVIGDQKWATDSPSSSYQASSSRRHEQQTPTLNSSVDVTRDMTHSTTTTTSSQRTPLLPRSTNTSTDALLEGPVLDVSGAVVDFEDAYRSKHRSESGSGGVYADNVARATDAAALVRVLSSHLEHTNKDVDVFVDAQLNKLQDGAGVLSEQSLRNALVSAGAIVERVDISAGPSVVRANMEDCLRFVTTVSEAVDELDVPSLAAVGDLAVELADTLHQLQSTCRAVHKMGHANNNNNNFTDTQRSVLLVKIKNLQDSLLPTALVLFDRLVALLAQGAREVHGIVKPFILEQMQSAQQQFSEVTTKIVSLHRGIASQSVKQTPLGEASYQWLAKELKNVQQLMHTGVTQAIEPVRKQLADMVSSPSSPSRSGQPKAPKALRSLARVLEHCSKLDAELEAWQDLNFVSV